MQEKNEQQEEAKRPSIHFSITHHPITQNRLLVMHVSDADGHTSNLVMEAHDALTLALQLQAQGMWLHVIQQEQGYQAQQQTAPPDLIVPPSRS